MAGLDTAALRLEDEVELDVVVVISLLVVVVELVVVVVEEVIILTGVALLGGFGLLILETVIPVVHILTSLDETDWKLFLQSKTSPRGDNMPEHGKEIAGLLVDVLVTVNRGEGFVIVHWAVDGGGSSMSSQIFSSIGSGASTFGFSSSVVISSTTYSSTSSSRGFNDALLKDCDLDDTASALSSADIELGFGVDDLLFSFLSVLFSCSFFFASFFCCSEPEQNLESS